MSEKRFTINMEYECIDDAKEEIFIHFNDKIDFYELCVFLNKLSDENEQLKKTLTETEEEKEHYADLYNECRRLKLSDEAIRKANAELNREEREKHSMNNAIYTIKSDFEVIY